MKNLWHKILMAFRRFFFYYPGKTRWQRVFPYLILGVLTLVVLVAGTVTWNYTNSSPFCGTTCHTMPPQYSAYLNSPHARVNCVECHIGRDIITTQFSRKAGDLRHVVLNITKQYEYPIQAHQMRPAREACETCHFPEKFSDDSLREIQNYGLDENNTPSSIYLIMKTGGGTEREGLGFGIHWHVENLVQYYATDKLEQDIPYVRVTEDDGSITEYYDISSGFTGQDVVGEYLETMDCITCHNRITHDIPQPEEAISLSISKGLIPDDLPYIVEQSVALLRGDYADKETGIQSMANLETYYQENFPDIYEQRSAEIQAAVIVLQDIYNQNVFPEQKSDWDSHPDNLGHKTDPGCFRCHDGKHFTSTGEAIRLECNLCHAIPVVAQSGSFTTNIELVSGPEPPSHTHTSWIALHSSAIDKTCSSCHTLPEGVDSPDDLDGKPEADGSFCGNTACHGNEWTYSGFGDPALQPVLEEQLFHLLNTSPYLLADVTYTYENTFSSIFEGRCTACHNPVDLTSGLDLSSYAGALAGGNSGPGIEPGNPDGSMIYIRQSDPNGHFSQLLPDELQALIDWIQAGAPEK